MAANYQIAQTRTTDVNNFGPRLVLMAVLFGYWIFAYILERVPLDPSANIVLNALGELPLPEPISSLFYWGGGMFSLRVLRHFVPIFIGWLFAYNLVSNVTQMLYELPDGRTARQTIHRLQHRELPYALEITLKQDEFVEQQASSPLLRVGGPARVAVTAGNAIVTELNGRFRRVLGPGSHSLLRFERVIALLDLRLQERTETNVKATTRDGIELETDITITFRIQPSGDPVTKTNPFPFSPEAVRKAAYTATVLTGGAVSNWQAYSLTTAVSKLRDCIAEQQFDDLFNLEQSTELYEALRDYVKLHSNNMLANSGVVVETVRIGWLRVTNADVTEQRIRYWQSLRSSAWRLSLADGQAEAMASTELARADAEAAIIEAIVEAIQRARREGRPGTTREIIALRLVESLERITRRNEAILPTEEHIQRQLQAINQRLVIGRSTDTAANNDNKTA